MKERKFELSRRKILASVGGIGVASAAGGLGTSAFFSDREDFRGNRLVAGSLDLKVDWTEHYSDWSDDEDIEGVIMPEVGSGFPVLFETQEAQEEFMNATAIESFPDADDDGLQDPIVDPCGPDSNLADMDEGLSDGLRTDSRPEGIGGEPNPQVTAPGDPLVDITDVKPGDSGEVTFSLHPCGNPGYIWMDAQLVENAENGLTEPEAKDPDEDDEDPNEDSLHSGELADEIRAIAWYDDDCDNVFDGVQTDTDPETWVFASGTLREVLRDFRSGDVQLDPTHYTTFSESGADSCEVLDTIDLANLDTQTTYTISNGGAEATIEFSNIEFKDGYPIELDFEVVDGNVGICRADAIIPSPHFGQPDTVIPYTFNGCVRSYNDIFGICHTIPFEEIRFYYCESGGEPFGDPGARCFEPDETYCIGFLWWLPVDHANEIQTDSVAFDLGFYTEQCRHNDGSRMDPEVSRPMQSSVTVTTEDTAVSASARHRIEVIVGDDLDGSTLDELAADYQSDFDLSNVGAGDVVNAGVEAPDGTAVGTTLLTNVTVSDNNSEITFTFDSPGAGLSKGDTIFFEYEDAQNASTPGTYAVVVGVNGTDVGSDTLDIV